MTPKNPKRYPRTFNMPKSRRGKSVIAERHSLMQLSRSMPPLDHATDKIDEYLKICRSISTDEQQIIVAGCLLPGILHSHIGGVRRGPSLIDKEVIFRQALEKAILMDNSVNKLDKNVTSFEIKNENPESYSLFFGPFFGPSRYQPGSPMIHAHKKPSITMHLTEQSQDEIQRIANELQPKITGDAVGVTGSSDLDDSGSGTDYWECKHRASFKTETAAWSWINELRSSSLGNERTPYRCYECKQWHLYPSNSLTPPPS